MAFIPSRDPDVSTSVCNCDLSDDFCCWAQTDLLSVSVYYLAHALLTMGGEDYTDPATMRQQYLSTVSSLTDTKGAAYSMQWARCLALGLGSSVEENANDAKAAAKGFQSKFNVRELILIQGLLMWLIIVDCMCEE